MTARLHRWWKSDARRHRWSALWLLLGLLHSAPVPTLADPAPPAADADGTDPVCHSAIPDDIAEYLITATLKELGQQAQAELVTVFLASDRLTPAERTRVKAFAQGADADPDPLQRLDLEHLALHLVDYGRFPVHPPAGLATFCATLTPRNDEDCGGSTHAQVHNLIAALLVNRYGLCDTRFAFDNLIRPLLTDPAQPCDQWDGFVVTQPGRAQLVLLCRLGDILAAPNYYARLEGWLEETPDYAFNRQEQFFVLLYLDYLKGSIERRNIDTAFRELLLRRRDLRLRYPVLEAVHRQLGRLKDLGRID